MTDRVVVYWQNPSEQWQQVADVPDEGEAHAIAATYEVASTAPIYAWIHDDAGGWRLVQWA